MSTIVNEIVALDGTDAADRLSRIRALDTSIRLLKEQRDAETDRIKSLLGEAPVGTLDGIPVVRFDWRNRTNVNAASLRAMSESIFTAVSRTSRYRSFELIGGKK